MPKFSLPLELKFNRARIEDPPAYARESGCASWLYLNGDEYGSMPGGMTYAQVQSSVDQCARVVTDPPRVLDLELARQHVHALDTLQRPTLISCRAGPRASAVAYMYAGLKAGAAADDVLAAAEVEQAPFCAFPEYKDWVRMSIGALCATGEPPRK